MSKAAYPGSFDPITKGHLDIIERASHVFDEVFVIIMRNPSKHYVFSEQQRKAMIEKCIGKYSNVKVIIGSGLTVDFASSIGCNVLIRGIRAVSDYEFELQQATANFTLNPNIETFLMVSRPEYSFLSSSLAKQIAAFNGDVSSCIPQEIMEEFVTAMTSLETGRQA